MGFQDEIIRHQASVVRDVSGVNHVNTISTVTTKYYQNYQKIKAMTLPKIIVNKKSGPEFTHYLVPNQSESNQQLIQLPYLESFQKRNLERTSESRSIQSPALSLSIADPVTCVSDSELAVDNKITNSEFKIVQGNTQ